MNRRITGVTALLITFVFAPWATAQMPPAMAVPPGGVAWAGSVPSSPMPGGPGPMAPAAYPYPTQPALYTQAAGVGSQVQLANCPSCQPNSGGPMAGPAMMPVAPMPPGAYGGYGIPMESAVDCYGEPCGDQACYAGDCSPYDTRPGWLHRLCSRCKGGCSLFDWSCLGWSHGPYGDGGCCLPRWYDVHAEWLYWTRDFNDSLTLASEGILGPDALNVDQMDFDWESGFRVTWAYPIAPATALEATYFGQLNWASSAAATSDNNLYSVFSNFGSDPLFGFPETDAAYYQGVSLSSELDNGELNLRHRWVSANCMLHSSWLVGVRYLRLREDMIYATETNEGSMDYRLKTDNDLVGAQLGTELYLCLTPRFKVGGEIEAGVYGTHSNQRTNVDCTSCAPLKERNSENDVAFIGEAGVMALFRVTPRLTARAGYQVLFIDGVALAVDNFNTVSPFSARDSFLDTTGNVTYHGAAAGFEWTW